jgi:hypothetical protein
MVHFWSKDNDKRKKYSSSTDVIVECYETQWEMCPFVKHLYWHFCITSCSIYLKQLSPNYDSMPSFTIFWQHLVFIYLFSAWKDILVWFILVRQRYNVVFALHTRILYLSHGLLRYILRLYVGQGNGFESCPCVIFLSFFLRHFSHYEAMRVPLGSCQVHLQEAFDGRNSTVRGFLSGLWRWEGKTE